MAAVMMNNIKKRICLTVSRRTRGVMRVVVEGGRTVCVVLIPKGERYTYVVKGYHRTLLGDLIHVDISDVSV